MDNGYLIENYRKSQKTLLTQKPEILTYKNSRDFHNEPAHKWSDKLIFQPKKEYRAL